MNLQSLFKKFLENALNNEEYQEFERKGKQLIYQVLSKEFSFEILQVFKKYYGNEYLRDLFQEFTLHLWERREKILSLNLLHINYFKTIIKNLLLKLLQERLSESGSEISFSDLQNSISAENSEEEIRFEESLSPYVVDYLVRLNLESLLNALKESLSEKEKETLCLYLRKFTGEKGLISSSYRDRIYKRWERLKPKLRKIFLDFGFCEELEKSQILEVIVSEFCKDVRFK